MIYLSQVDLRKVAVGDADEELLGTAVEFADPDLLRFWSQKVCKTFPIFPSHEQPTLLIKSKY